MMVIKVSGILLVTIVVLALIIDDVADAGPMYYKKVAGQKYEPDWVPVSSTVIPLAEYRVSVGGGGGAGVQSPLVADDEYRRAYLRHKQLEAANSGKVVKLKTASGRDGSEADVKAAARVQDDPDTLITAKKKFYERKNN